MKNCCYNICYKKNKTSSNNTTNNEMTTCNNPDILKNINAEKNSTQNINNK